MISRGRLGIALVAIAISLTSVGCGHKDELEQAAPPTTNGANGLGNAAGQKPTAGSQGAVGMGGGAAPMGGAPMKKP